MHACCSFLCESLVWFSVCFCVCVCLWFLYHYFVYVVIHSKQFTNNGSIKINENFTKHLNFTGEQIDRKNYIILHGLFFSYVCWFLFLCFFFSCVLVVYYFSFCTKFYIAQKRREIVAKRNAKESLIVGVCLCVLFCMSMSTSVYLCVCESARSCWLYKISLHIHI